MTTLPPELTSIIHKYLIKPVNVEKLHKEILSVDRVEMWVIGNKSWIYFVNKMVGCHILGSNLYCGNCGEIMKDNLWCYVCSCDSVRKSTF